VAIFFFFLLTVGRSGGADLITSASATGAPVYADSDIVVAISAHSSVGIAVRIFCKILHFAVCRITVWGVSRDVVGAVLVVTALPLLGKGWVIHKPTVGTGYLGPGGGGEE